MRNPSTTNSAPMPSRRPTPLPRACATAELQSSQRALAGIRATLGENQYALGKYELAAQVFSELTTSDSFAEFLTLPGYAYLD